MSIPVFAGVTGFILLISLMLWRIWAKERARMRVTEDGTPAKARITSIDHTGVTMSVGGHRHLKLTIGLEVHGQGKTHAANATQLVSELHVPLLQPNTWVDVRVANSDPTKAVVLGNDNQRFATRANLAVVYKAATIITLIVGLGLVGGFGVFLVDWTGEREKSCAALVRCCEAVFGAQGNCASYAREPDLCAPAFETFKVTAQAQGVNCD